MERTTATGSVGGFYVNKDIGLGKPGTKIIALDKNNIQEEIIASIERAGIDLSTDRFQAVDSLEIIRKPVQSIIAGKLDANGEADYLTESAGVIGIDTDSGVESFIASCADGYNISKVANRQTRIYYDSDQASLWDLSGEADDDYYLFLDIDSSNVVTGIFSDLAPVYDYAFPTSPGTGQFFYQLTSNKVYVWSGSTWEQKVRVCVGYVTKAAGPVYTLYPQKITIEYGRYNVFGDGNLNIEADSVINQDLTTDADVQHNRVQANYLANKTANDLFFEINSVEKMRLNGTYSALYVKGGISSTDGQPIVKQAIVDIGSWDMISTPSKAVTTPSINPQKVISMIAIINEEVSPYRSFNLESPFSTLPDWECQGGIFGFNGSSVTLYRKTGGLFDTAGFDDPGFPRGRLYIEYIVP